MNGLIVEWQVPRPDAVLFDLSCRIHVLFDGKYSDGGDDDIYDDDSGGDDDNNDDQYDHDDIYDDEDHYDYDDRTSNGLQYVPGVPTTTCTPSCRVRISSLR